VLRRRAWSASLIAACLLGGLAGAACLQQDGVGLAREACVHVNKSLKLYTAAQTETDPALAASDLQGAYNQLRLALPIAADATSENGQWNPLMTTLAESSRVSEQYLVTGLRAQCTFADSANPQLPPNPTTLPPGSR
jgi:hypothetical protein